MDRLAPMQRPDQLCLALQTWRDLLLLHWAVPVREIRRLLPEGLQPDLYRGVAYVGVALLEASSARPAFVPVKVGLRYLQATVRTYVHAGGENPGIYLLSLDSSSRLVSRLVRMLVNVPSFTADLTHMKRRREIEIELRRGGASPADLSVRYSPARELGELQPGSLAFFLLERYVLYFESAGLLFRSRLHHAPQRARNVRVREMRGSLVEAAGVTAPAHVPRHAYHVDQVELEIFPPELVERTVPIAEETLEPAWQPRPRLSTVSGCSGPGGELP